MLQNQPEWRVKFLRQHKMIKEYVEAPRDLTIDPKFCPFPHHHRWDKYEKMVECNPNALNFLKLPLPSYDQQISEAEFKEMIKGVLEKYKDV